MRVRRELSIGEIDWPGVLELLRSRFQLDVEPASRDISELLGRLKRPLSLEWFLRRELRPADNRILAAAADRHGADCLCVTSSSSIAFGWLSMRFEQRYEFFPAFRAKDRGRVLASYVVCLRRRQFKLSNALSVFLLQLALFSLATLGYAVTTGAFFYSVAVLLVFINEPVAMALLARSNSGLFLGLIGVLSGVSAASGQALRNLSRALRAPGDAPEPEIRVKVPS